jgi:hypothetical protein
MMSGFFGINPLQYNVWNELGFLLNPTIQSFVEPTLRKYLAMIPDEQVKDVAMSYADAMLKQAQEKGYVNVFGIQLQNANIAVSALLILMVIGFALFCKADKLNQK